LKLSRGLVLIEFTLGAYYCGGFSRSPGLPENTLQGEKMRKFKLIVLLGAIFGLLTLGLGMPGILLAAPQTKCPVLSGTVDKKVFVDYQGKRIYFCCKACIAEFEKNPDQYLKKLAAEGVTPEKAPSGQ
jgi:YHS domain-containing protein